MKFAIAAVLLFSLAVATLADPAAIEPAQIQVGADVDGVILHGKLCHFCEHIIEEAEKLGEKYTKKWLEKKIDIVCDALLILAHECKKELNKLIDKLDDFILKHASPQTACHAIDLCKK